ncbi:MAG: metal ABC transporter ATP-binding protein [Endomicrobiaceae bacterium]|jgi:ABC-type Mn2+/Zn2+ transport system ATPase subunit|nr:metal ABC transporter ATP-binding protein [Endomicrobiaceae bacterium]MDD3729616.1 metal ABC transporter ATP-binding protein [Endomicrobiaceae bacterium]MDD4165408.1 metal ABC transporter ATP-binding protein [Endomicrobiaceae bacterium]
MTNIVSVKNLTAIKNKRAVLKEINVEIEHGDCVAVIGPNGAGKTTFIKTINGLTAYSQGSVNIFGNALNQEIKRKIGYIPQNNNFDALMPISVREVISIGFTSQFGIFKKFTDFDKKTVEDISKGLNIFNLIDKPVGQLSGGESQKVSIARVLAQNPKLILMDEPLSNLDKKTQTDILNLIDFIYHEQNITMLIVVHNLSQMPKCCNKVILMADGKIIDYGKKESVFANKEFRNFYNL